MLKVRGLDGREYTLDIKSATHKMRSRASCKSGIQFEIGQLLRKRYPMAGILEEVHLPGSGGLYVDFLIPSVKTAVEVHGGQHDEYVPYLHKSPKGFVRSQERDFDKEKWMMINDFTLLVFRSVEEAAACLGVEVGTQVVKNPKSSRKSKDNV